MDMSLEKEEENSVVSKVEAGSSWISSSNQSSSTSGSSSTGFSTPLYSDLESDDGDFIAELTHQMAEWMLQEEEEEEGNTVLNYVSNESSPEQSYADYGAINNLKNGPVCVDDRIQPSQVYELQNQPPVRKQGHFCRERGIKGTESAQQKTHHHYMQKQYRGRNEHSGSGMHAVFLGGSGWKSESPGTGVFLPWVTSDPTQLKKKPGRSIVLMPTRVLQALEIHFNQRHNSIVPPLSGGSLIHKVHADDSTTSNGHSQLEKRPANSDEIQLPQEWTY